MTPEVAGDLRTSKEKQVELGTWGVFFVWLGLAILARPGWGVWLLGVGAIILGAQLIRRLLALRTDLFWIGAGAGFVIGGLSALSGVHLALIPILCILAGAGLMAKAMSRRMQPRHA